MRNNSSFSQFEYCTLVNVKYYVVDAESQIFIEVKLLNLFGIVEYSNQIMKENSDYKSRKLINIVPNQTVRSFKPDCVILSCQVRHPFPREILFFNLSGESVKELPAVKQRLIFSLRYSVSCLKACVALWLVLYFFTVVFHFLVH
jgi:hypothetical protein